ncbi:MAG TPA: serine--tRNA ligase [Methyloceanibacter sp.]|nr:serine--tRNA ligase [Methyloceanibacter sp.]
MLDVKWIRENQEAFIKGLSDRAFGDPQATLTQIVTLDEQRRETIQALQELQATRNAASKDIGKAKQAKDEAEAKRLMDEVAGLKATIQEGEDKEREQDKALHDLLAGIPNIPADDVPVGPDESANVELRKVGAPPKFSFKPKEHFEIGEGLGLMDFETAAKLSGSRFVILKGPLARLERALAQFMLDLHTDRHGYTEVNPPLLVRDDTMFGTAQLPKFADDQFEVSRSSFEKMMDLVRVRMVTQLPSFVQEYSGSGLSFEEAANRLFESIGRMMPFTRDEYEKVTGLTPRLWLIPTAEVPLTNLARDDITDEAKLPRRVTAGTPCFRAEAGAAGRDTRGMIRQHQFTKVELVSVTTPEQSADEHERMTQCAETVLQKLGLPYRVVVLSTGDMGFAAQKTYDIEVWLPGQDTYREISSCSNCGDFQARRMNARYRPKDSKATQFVHTLNGSGVAVGRALIAVLENYQEADGSVRVPEALQPYMGGMTKIEAAK